jgi:GNAT superfamily N-acetyltransferase
MFNIRAGRPADAEILSSLALRSKAYWGYDDKLMEKFKGDIVVNAADISNGHVFIAEDNQTIIGFCRFHSRQSQGILDDLFVEPAYIGKGVGGLLLDTAIHHAAKLGIDALEIHADPHAEDFYLHMGAKKIGTVPSESVPGRELPLLTLRTKI